jgi:hypothetical protein
MVLRIQQKQAGIETTPPGLGGGGGIANGATWHHCNYHRSPGREQGRVMAGGHVLG